MHNDTHVFWPMRERLFSKFYMRVAYENQELYGISHQTFSEQPIQAMFQEMNTFYQLLCLFQFY